MTPLAGVAIAAALGALALIHAEADAALYDAAAPTRTGRIGLA